MALHRSRTQPQLTVIGHTDHAHSPTQRTDTHSTLTNPSCTYISSFLRYSANFHSSPSPAYRLFDRQNLCVKFLGNICLYVQLLRKLTMWYGLHSSTAPCDNRSISSAGRATAANLQQCMQWPGGIDRRTDAWQMHRPCSVYYASVSASKPCNWCLSPSDLDSAYRRSIDWYVDVELKSHVCRYVVIKSSHMPKCQDCQWDRRWDSEVSKPVCCSTSSFRTRSYHRIPSSCLGYCYLQYVNTSMLAEVEDFCQFLHFFNRC